MISKLLLIEEFFIYDFHDIVVDVTYEIFDILCVYVAIIITNNLFLLKTSKKTKKTLFFI